MPLSSPKLLYKDIYPNEPTHGVVSVEQISVGAFASNVWSTTWRTFTISNCGGSKELPKSSSPTNSSKIQHDAELPAWRTGRVRWKFPDVRDSRLSPALFLLSQQLGTGKSLKFFPPVYTSEARPSYTRSDTTPFIFPLECRAELLATARPSPPTKHIQVAGKHAMESRVRGC